MTLAYALPSWGWVLLASAIGAVAWAAYRRVGGVVSSRQRAVLMALRAAVLVVLLLILLRPVRVAPAPPAGGTVPILVDASASMSLTDGGSRSRYDAALELARTRLAPSLVKAGFQPELLTFGETVTPLSDGVQVEPAARASRLGEALHDVRDRTAGRAVAGVVVLSDGAVHAGSAKSISSARVFAVPVGADTVRGDREVFGITIGDARLQGSLVDLSALVVSRGPSRDPFEVRLDQNGQPIDVRRLTPAGDGAAQRVRFRVAPSRDATTVYTVSVAAAADEATLANNRQSVLTTPAGPPRRVLLIEGAPGHEHSFLKRSLDKDAGLEIDAVVRKGEDDQGAATFYVQAGGDRGRQLLGGFPADRTALFAYDAVVLANVDAAMLPAPTMAMLADFVAERGGGLLLLGARSFEVPGGLANTPLATLAPVDLIDRAGGLVRTASRGREPLRVSLTEDGVEHPVMRLGADAEDTRKRWEAAPALAASAALGPARPGAILLATTAVPGGVVRPLVAVQRYGRGRTLLFGGEASWRWKMMLGSDDATYDTFWRQAIRWAAGDATGPVAVSATADEGHRVSVLAEVRDAEFAPAHDATVRVRIADPEGRDVEVPATRDSATGTVAAAFDAAASGVHKVTVEARRGPAVLGTADAWVLVGGVETEFVHPRRETDVLQRVAVATGGRLVEDADLDRVPEWLASTSAPHVEMTQREAWHSPLAWMLVVGLLGAEWALRRRWGLR